jgi:multiple sugar transport system permease protein
MIDISAGHAPRRRFKVSRRALPYVLSLPALLVCIGILIPFVTAVLYSFQRYRLSQPWSRQWNWGENYLDFLTDAAFWNTVRVSVTYAGLTVTIELLLGLGIALLLQKRTRFNNVVSVMLLMPLMTAPALAALDVEADDQPRLRHLQLLRAAAGLREHELGSSPDTALFTGRPGRTLGLHALHHDPAARGPALAAPAALRGGGARRRAALLRLLAHHPADADCPTS